jgi:hypothetical protein
MSSSKYDGALSGNGLLKLTLLTNKKRIKIFQIHVQLTVPAYKPETTTPSEPERIASREEYFKLLELHNGNKIDASSKLWETVKFFQSIFSALIVATVVAVVAAINGGLFQSISFRLLVCLLPTCGGISLFAGIRNLRRETQLLYEEEGDVFKLAHLLKLNRNVQPENRLFPNDEYLFSDKWRNDLPETRVSKSSHDWIEARTKRTGFLKLFCRLFWIEIAVAIISVLMILVVGGAWRPLTK